MQVAADKQALSEARDEIQNSLIARGPATFMDPSEERVARVEVLQGAWRQRLRLAWTLWR